MSSSGECEITSNQEHPAVEDEQTHDIELKELRIPDTLKNLQENPGVGHQMNRRRLSTLSHNPKNRPKVDILTELAQEGYGTLYEQMEKAISECEESEDILEKVVKKTRELNVGKLEAIFEVYLDLIITMHCGNSVHEALLWVIDEQQQFREFCAEVFVIRLLDRKAEISYSKSDGTTALHLAAKRGFSNVAKILIERDLLERGLLDRVQTSTDTKAAGGIVYCKAKVQPGNETPRETPLEIAAHRAIELATCKDASKYETFKRRLGLVKDSKECQDYCEFAVLMIKNMESKRVRELFQADSKRDGRVSLSLHELLKYKSLTDLALAVLDTMCEPVEGDKTFTVHYSILEGDEKGYPPDHKKFERSRKSCLYKIARSQNKKVVYHDAVRLLLRRKWRSFARTIFWLQFVWYLLVFIMLTVALVLAAKKQDPCVYNSYVDYIRLICEVCLIMVVIVYNGVAEIRQMYRHRCYYLLDRFNYIDVPAVLFTILIIPFRITGNKVQWVFAALSYLFNGLRAFKYASVNQLTGAYVQIIFRILLKDILRFGVVSLAFFLSFSGTFYFALRSEYDPSQNDTMTSNTSNTTCTDAVSPTEDSEFESTIFETGEIYEVWLIGFRVVIEGTGVINTYFQSSHFKVFGMMIYLSFIFVIIVLLLNLLVAQMSNTYNTILNEAQYALLLNRAWIVARIEHNSFCGWILHKLCTKLKSCRHEDSENQQQGMRLYIPHEIVNPQEELEKWDIPKIDAIQKKVEAIELQQRKLFNAVIDMRYFTEYLPVLLFTSLPLSVLGVWQCPTHWSRAPFWLALWELIVHSVLSHKEHRYVLSIVPIASIYAGHCISNLLVKYKNRILPLLVWLLLLCNIPMSLYFSLVHQRGTVAVMDYLRKDIDNQSSVLFLMPCHTTPFYSHIHHPISMEFLECPPPIRSDYIDISRQFYSDPEGWLQGKFPDTNTLLPSHLVLFDVLVPKVASFLSKSHYNEVVKLFHTQFPESSRYGHYVVVMKRRTA